VPAITEKMKFSSRTPAGGMAATRMLIARVEYVEGEPETYLLPVLFAQGEQEQNILGDRPGAGLMSIARSDDGEGATLCDTTHEDEFWLLLYDAIARGRAIPGRHGIVEPHRTRAFSQLEHGPNAPQAGTYGKPRSRVRAARSSPVVLDVSVHGGEQSNTSAVIGNQMIFKLYRKIGRGENPDLEIGRYLTERTQLTCVPQVAGALEYRDKSGDQFTLAVLHEYVANQGDAWVYTLDELGRYLERIESELSSLPPAETLPNGASLLELADRIPPTAAQDAIGPYLRAAELLGRRTAELHLALAAGEEESFAPEPFSKLYQRGLYQSMRAQARKTLGLLGKRLKTLPDTTAELANRLLQNEQVLVDRYRDIADIRITAQRTRCHGDFHLGQILFTGKDFVIIDFEGEPDRSIGERRIKRSPLRDVAGMIRSFHYASHAAARSPHHEALHPSADGDGIAPWLNVWYDWSSACYLKAYLTEMSRSNVIPGDHEELESLFNAYLLEKAVYELGYELNNRPDWVQIPIEGILHLLAPR